MSHHVRLRMNHTGWRRCIRCLKLQVSFLKKGTDCRALLRKETSKAKTSCVRHRMRHLASATSTKSLETREKGNERERAREEEGEKEKARARARACVRVCVRARECVFVCR